VSKNANAGELRTPVYFKSVSRTTGTNGNTIPEEENVFGQDADKHDIPVRVKWVNVHGTEVMTALQLKLREPAVITMRYSPLINRLLVVYKEDDPVPFEIISVDDVENRHKWMEINVQRKVPAR
jgi:hypothetical protein